MSSKEEIFGLYAQLVDIPQIVPSDDLSAARAWINMTEYFLHSTTLLAYETGLRSLIYHLATVPLLPRHLNLIKGLTSSPAVDAFSTCLRSHSPIKAVELLEQGQGVFLTQLSRLCSSVDDDLESDLEGKTLADMFMQLTSLIRRSLDSPGADQHDRVCCLNIELHRAVSDTRRLSSHFPLPPPFSDLRKAAIGGPIVIVNASKYTCDALIVLLDLDPVYIPLQITRDQIRNMTLELHSLTKLVELMNVGRYFVGILRELWDKLASPIVNFLMTIYPSQSRVLWCPTVVFSLAVTHCRDV